MTEAQKILSLIETVDLSDDEAMDHINFMFHSFRLVLKGSKKAHEYFKGGQGYMIANKRGRIVADILKRQWSVTTSLDAVASIQPEGWWLFLSHETTCETVRKPTGRTTATLRQYDKGIHNYQVCETAKNECFARLAATIQAIEHERNSK